MGVALLRFNHASLLWFLYIVPRGMECVTKAQNRCSEYHVKF